MNPYTYLDKYKSVYALRDTKRRFIPIEKIANDPIKYGYKYLLEDFPDDYRSEAKQEAFIKDKSKVCALICANRSGKTEALSLKAIKTLESIKKDQGGRYWLLSESFDLQKAGVQSKLAIYIKDERIVPGSIGFAKKDAHNSFKYINKHGVIIPVEYKTYEQGVEKLQSAKLYGASFDEEPKDEKVYDEVYTRTVDLKGQIGMAFTPLRGFTWSYRRILNSKSKNIKVYNWGMADNPFIPRSEIEEMKATLTKKAVAMRLYGKYQGSEGMCFYEFDRKVHLKPNLYDPRFEVHCCIDWGVRVTSIGFFQEKKIESWGKIYYENYLIDAMELEGKGYDHVMKAIFQKKYYIKPNGWYCDPASRSRIQAQKMGVSLLAKIKEEFGVTFQYIKSLGVEESIEIVNMWLMNADNKTRFYIQDDIKLNAKMDTPAQRIEGYIRDDETNLPIKDEINDHFCDMTRYLIANRAIMQSRPGWRQT